MEMELPHRHEAPETLMVLARFLEKTEDFQLVADLFRQLSDPTRLRVFWLLCHCEECVLDLSALLGISSPALSHHLRQLREAGLIVSHRRGKEVYYQTADSEQAALLHGIIERTMAVSCPKDTPLEAAPHLPVLDTHTPDCHLSAGQLATAQDIHEYLLANLERRVTIEELSARFLMNATTLKALFRAVYGTSLAAHVREHRMAAAAQLLRETDTPVAEIARGVGYESQSRFSDEFRKYAACLPSEYRRLYGKL